MRQPGDIPMGVGATTADIEAMIAKYKGEEVPLINPGKLFGTPEHSVNLQLEVVRLTAALHCIRDELGGNQINIQSNITGVLNGEKYNTPGIKSKSWLELNE